MKKIIIITLSITISIILGILAVFTLPWAILFVGLNMSPNPPKPTITHGEFPFHLVYEVDGKQYTIDDTIICDYAGTGMNEARGKHIKWEERLASGNKISKFNFSFTEDDQYGIKLFDGIIQGQGSTTIICDVGNPQYYLGYKKYPKYTLIRCFAFHQIPSTDIKNKIHRPILSLSGQYGSKIQPNLRSYL
ncbi:hypothetical protein [Geosporobacter ferrireducens]|uniref:Uncharacterized protein n=1 Tax=Geosporobacter ferrireducens TaxID=1424294 RepID=A0A1D8GKL1_9FIRM|nr:hypothetical protein [Geosporobacter ferrireducens]AOT71444.1 hypothetical protein Gferi_19065 [Geosporobacter ferrireducens]MTI57750.1 hypothetical protein [Geosporobacter ferrireducens]